MTKQSKTWWFEERIWPLFCMVLPTVLVAGTFLFGWGGEGERRLIYFLIFPMFGWILFCYIFAVVADRIVLHWKMFRACRTPEYKARQALLTEASRHAREKYPNAHWTVMHHVYIPREEEALRKERGEL